MIYIMDERKIKLILLGEYSVGKTSIMTRKNDNYFSNCYTSTIGVDFFSYKTFVNEKPLIVHVWDTAGEEKFRFIIKSYFNGADGALLVFDLTNKQSFEKLDYWLQELQTYKFDGKIIVMGTKSDLEYRREIDKQEAQDFCDLNNLNYIECSSKENINIDNAFNSLISEIVNFPNPNIQNKVSSFTIKEHEINKKSSCCMIQ